MTYLKFDMHVYLFTDKIQRTKTRCAFICWEEKASVVYRVLVV